MAVVLAHTGSNVACQCHNTSKVDETVDAIEKLGRRSVSIPGDMSDKETPKRVVADVIAAFGRIDILINNAGMIRRTPAVDYSEEDWSTVIEVNLSSVFRTSQPAGRHMIKQGSGKIVNIASLLSFQC